MHRDRVGREAVLLVLVFDLVLSCNVDHILGHRAHCLVALTFSSELVV